MNITNYGWSTRVLEPDRGEVRWRGRPVDIETRRRFGYMPEDHG
jgi:ABC-2 type transport system ATP-binding protein